MPKFSIIWPQLGIKCMHVQEKFYSELRSEILLADHEHESFPSHIIMNHIERNN